jgi:hypothetical protein
MCHFIHIAVPSSHANWFNQQTWPHFSHAPAHIPKSHPLYPHTRAVCFHSTPAKGCACGSYDPPRVKPATDFDQIIQKYLAKGWSQSKAHRAARQVIENTGPAAPGTFRDPIPTVIAQIVASVGACAVLVEWPCTKEDKTSMYPGKGDVRCTLAEFQATCILEGRLYLVRP